MKSDVTQEPLRILLVDDDAQSLSTVSESLRGDYGHDVDAVGNFESASHLIESAEQRYDVALINDLLPRRSGLATQRLGVELMGMIKKDWTETQVVIVSASGAEHALEAVQAGAFRYITKPLAMEELEIVVRHASLLTAANKQKYLLDSLVRSSPNGIISIDQHGSVTEFNEQAERILGYERTEVLNTSVSKLYYDPDEPARIGDLISKSPGGILTGHETWVKNKSGQNVDIRLSATFLNDTKGERVGSVGYFEERRSALEVDRRFDLLLKGSSVVDAATLTEGLEGLAKMLVLLLSHTFCRILLFDESRSFLVVKAAYPVQRSSPSLVWEPGVGERIAMSEYEGLTNLLEGGRPKVITWTAARPSKNLERFSRRLDLTDQIQSLLLLPLRVGNSCIGLIDIGEVRGAQRGAFRAEEVELAFAIAAQTTAIIDRMQLHANTKRREQLLSALDQSSRSIRAIRETSHLMQEIVRLAAELVGFDAGGLLVNRAYQQQLELTATHGLPEEIMGRHIPHSEGLVGAVARSGKREVMRDYSNWPGAESLLQGFALQTLLAVPLRQLDEVEAVLFVGDSTGRVQLADADIDVVERFARQASIALQTARLISEEGRRSTQLTIIHKISDYIQSAKDLDTILHVVLTGVTAEYGLRFNRAVLLLLDESRSTLVGRMGIGQFEESDARQAWVRDEASGLIHFDRYLRSLKKKHLPMTPLDEWTKQLRMPTAADQNDAFSRAMLTTRYVRVTPQEFENLPPSFAEVFKPTTPVGVIPLTARDVVIGLLVVDNKFTKSQITEDDLALLITFANTAAIAIDNHNLLRDSARDRDRLRSSLKASNALVSPENPEQVLEMIVAQAPVAADAAWARVILIDEKEQAWKQFARGIDRAFELKGSIRPEGISIQVMRNGEPEAIPDVFKERDRVNPFMLERGIRSAICLPLSVQGKPIGVMWINYVNPHIFNEFEIEALQLYVNQAAIAYDSARGMEELNRLHESAQEMSRAVSTTHASETIVAKAVEMFRADSATLWPYDHVNAKFLPEGLVAQGISHQALEAFREAEPARDGVSYGVLQQGSIAVQNIEDPQYSFLRNEMRNRLRGVGVVSFQGILLSAGDEIVGVLYVAYHRPRAFTEEDSRLIKSFATYAGVSLKNARLIDQVRRATKSAELVAQVTALGDLDPTLRSVARGTLEAVGCDAVVLYAYDQRRDKWKYPPTHAGVRYPKEAWPDEEVPKTSIVREILNRPQLTIVERTDDDPMLKGRRFVIAEKIQSCVALGLRAGGKAVGVMWVNYRRTNRFTADELSAIELFANQAAVAIGNAQLFEEGTRKLEQQQRLARLSQDLLTNVSSQEILDRTVAIAANMLGAEFCSIVVPNESGKLIVSAAFGFDEGIVGTKLDATRGSHEEMTISLQEPVVVLDYANENEPTLSAIFRKYRIQSGVSVPVFSAESPQSGAIGVMVVHTKALRHFDEADQTLLALIANQASIAIKGAPQHEEIQRLSARLSVMSDLTRTVKAGPSQVRQFLSSIVEQAVKNLTRTPGPKAILGTIQMYDPTSNELVFECVHPGEELPHLVRTIGDARVVDRSRAPNGKIGVTGRTVESKKWQLVTRVDEDPDYIEFTPGTKSELAVPLLDEDRVIGVINVESNQEAAFGRDDVKALEELADLAVIAIKTARLIEEEQKHYRQMNAIHEIGLAINASQDRSPNATLDAILGSIRSIIEYTAAEICLWDEGKQALVVIDSAGTEGYADAPGLVYELDDSYAGLIFRNEKPLLIKDTQAPGEMPPTAIHSGRRIRSFVGVPVRVDDHRLATLELVSDRLAAFSEQDKDVLEDFASLVAVAIKTKQLRVATWTGALAAWGAEIAHDVSTEVGAIRRTLANLRLHPALPPELMEYVQKAERYAEALIFPTVHGPSATADLDKIVEAEVSRCEKRSPGVTWVRELDSPGKRVKISSWELSRVMKHLLHNAADADPVADRPRKVTVRTWSERKEAFLQVEDNGPGLPPDYETNVFWQPIKHEREGGFGLLLVRSMVERYDGSAYLKHNDLGVGACFEIRLLVASGDSNGEESSVDPGTT